MRLLAVAIAIISWSGCDSGDETIVPDTRVTFVKDADPPAPGPEHKTFPSAVAAVQALLTRRPRVVGFGEYHATIGGAPVVPSLTRFRKQILPSIVGLLGDIVVETWVEPAGCGKAAKKTAVEVKDAMQRPAETETEVFALLREARERKLGAHILEMSCKDYESFRSADKVDFDKPLSIVTNRLLATIEKTLAGAKSAATIAVYGGSLHNDVHPIKGFENYSYASKVEGLTKGGFLEIDLFVPELIADSALFKNEPWFELAKREASSEHVVVIERSMSSYVVILKRGVTLRASP